MMQLCLKLVELSWRAQHLHKHSLRMGPHKTKAMAVGSHLTPSDTLPLQLSEGEVEMVHDFTYQGSTITNDGEVKSEIGTRIAKAARAFGCLQKPEQTSLSGDQKEGVQSHCSIGTSLWNGNLDHQGTQCEAPKWLSQPLCQNHLGCQPTPTVEGPHFITAAGRELWDGRVNEGHSPQTSPALARTPRPYGH